MVPFKEVLKSLKKVSKVDKERLEPVRQSWSHLVSNTNNLSENDLLYLLALELDEKPLRLYMLERLHSRFCTMRTRREKLELGIVTEEEVA